MAFKVLIVEDEENIQQLVRVVLEREGYIITCASDGREALDQVASDRPDLVVMDVLMPRMGGFQVLRTLKSQEQTCHIPVIVLTARDGVTDVTDGLLLGADAYLTKPLNPQELVAFVRRLLSSENRE